MKRITAVLMLIAIVMSLVSCAQPEPVRNHVTYEQLPEYDRIMNGLSNKQIEKFVLAPGAYDISTALYKDGALVEELGGIRGAKDDAGNDAESDLYISATAGMRDATDGLGIDPMQFGVSFRGGTYIKPPYVIEDARSFGSTQGVGREDFDVEPGKEYVLMYRAYKAGDKMETSYDDAFLNWDDAEKRVEQLSYFDYAYVVTIRLSGDQPDTSPAQ